MKPVEVGQYVPPGEEAHRDAIHIAVLPVMCQEDLWPGGYLRFARNSSTEVLEADPDSKNAVGIVDPFLKEMIPAGTTFYMFMLPNTITGLRHHWTHPQVDVAPPVPTSKLGLTEAEQQRIAIAVAEQLTVGPQLQLLQNFAHEIDVSYDELMQGAKDYLDHDEYMSDGGKFEGTSVPNGFWDAYEAVTGEVVPKDKKDSFFSCSC